MKKKILLMGRSGCGKTSMRALIFSSALYPNPSSTRRLGTTLGVETSHFRFLKNLVISLFDMGGQQAYMDSYLDDRKGQLFKDVGAFVYVFDMGNVAEDDDGHQEWEGDFRYWKECLRLLHQNSPNAQVICLLHKMDLVDPNKRKEVYLEKCKQLTNKAVELGIQNLKCRGTSIWDETLYRAWSQIIHSLIPNITSLESNLKQFVEITGATEAVIFEKTTFLVIARSEAEQTTSSARQDSDPLLEGYPSTESERQSLLSAGKLHPDRFERISELVKNLRGTCQKFVLASGGSGNNDTDTDQDQDHNLASTGNQQNLSSSTSNVPIQNPNTSSSDTKPAPSSSLSSSTFQSFEIKGANFSAYLDWFTSNTYILVIVADPRVSLEAVKLNVQLGRDRFEKIG
ncbi:unnamed protein product [Sympodiomycopsis kandeliae]